MKRKNSNTVPKQLKPFTKGDPRINRKGRPRGFDVLRDLARSIAEEPSGAHGKNGIELTNAQMVLRSLMKNDGAKFLEIAYGKVPNPVEISSPDGGPVSHVMKIIVVNTDDPGDEGEK